MKNLFDLCDNYILNCKDPSFQSDKNIYALAFTYLQGFSTDKQDITLTDFFNL